MMFAVVDDAIVFTDGRIDAAREVRPPRLQGGSGRPLRQLIVSLAPARDAHVSESRPQLLAQPIGRARRIGRCRMAARPRTWGRSGAAASGPIVKWPPMGRGHIWLIQPTRRGRRRRPYRRRDRCGGCSRVAGEADGARRVEGDPVAMSTSPAEWSAWTMVTRMPRTSTVPPLFMPMISDRGFEPQTELGMAASRVRRAMAASQPAMPLAPSRGT
jgi:hypothetical protein